MSVRLPIYVPKETVSDDKCVVFSLAVTSGTLVKKGQVLAELETSKATLEVESPANGYFYYQVREGQEIDVRSLLGVLSDEAEDPRSALQRFLATPSSSPAVAKDLNSGKGLRITKAAQELMDRYALNSALFEGRQVVREQDVEEILRSRSVPPSSDTTPQTAARSLSGRILVVGGSLHAKTCLEILLQNNSFEVVGIVDQKMEAGKKLLGIPVIGTDEDLRRFNDEGIHLAVNAVGAFWTPRLRTTIFNRIKEAGFEMPVLVHPSAVVSPRARLGEGVQIMANATVDTDVEVGKNCMINTGAIVSHGCVIEDHVHIAPGAILAGAVTVGEGTLVGMGVTVYYRVKIGSNVTIPNGMNIFADVADGSTLHHHTKRAWPADTEAH